MPALTTPRISKRIDPDCRREAEAILATASPADRQFWERYLAVGDHDSFDGFLPAGGDRVTGSGASQFVISDLARAAARRGKIPARLHPPGNPANQPDTVLAVGRFAENLDESLAQLFHSHSLEPRNLQVDIKRG